MILRTDKLKVGYGKKTVVDDINVTLLEGQFVCLLGPNGCGKSTILKTIVRMLTPLGGEVYLNDRNIEQLTNRDMAKTTAVVLTDPISPGLMTAYDVVMLGRHPHTGFMGKPADTDSDKVVAALRTVNAEMLTRRYFGELSDGEKQKVMLARALAQEPKLIVLDEPTSHLDARHRIEVMLILRQLTQEKGVTVIASLHDIDLAMKACDVAILIKNEQVLASGTPEDVLKEDLVAQLYDIGRATFSGTLGGLELKTAGPDAELTRTCFVVAGAGSGAAVYRALAKHGFGIVTGVLPENDIDCHIATAVGATVIRSLPYEHIPPDAHALALDLMADIPQVIDAGFPLGATNWSNADLLLSALQSGKVVHTLRDRAGAEALYGDNLERVNQCKDFFELMAAVRKVERETKS